MKYATILLLTVLLFAGCKKTNDNSNVSNTPNVYIAGYKHTIQGNEVAILWKNGVVQHLTNGSANRWATSIFVK